MSSNESLARRIEDPHDCADCYVDAVTTALAATLREVGPTLIEPRAPNPDRAVRALACFVETFTGYVLGTIARHLTAGMRRWFGDDGLATTRAAMHGWPALPAPIEVHGTDTARPLAGELLAQLHVRFCAVSAHVRQLAGAIPERAMTRLMFSSLAQDDLLARKIADELARGWRVYIAAVTTKRYPELNGLWQAFVDQLDGRPVLTRDAVAEAGYITLVR